MSLCVDLSHVNMYAGVDVYVSHESKDVWLCRLVCMHRHLHLSESLHQTRHCVFLFFIF